MKTTIRNAASPRDESSSVKRLVIKFADERYGDESGHEHSRKDDLGSPTSLRTRTRIVRTSHDASLGSVLSAHPERRARSSREASLSREGGAEPAGRRARGGGPAAPDKAMEAGVRHGRADGDTRRGGRIAGLGRRRRPRGAVPIESEGHEVPARKVGALPAWLMDEIAASCPLEDRDPERKVFLRVDEEGLRMAMRRACTTAAIPLYSPHDLRHRRITIWHHAGVPPKEIGARVGHARASMTLDVYSHVMPVSEVPVDELLALLRRSGEVPVRSGSR